MGLPRYPFGPLGIVETLLAPLGLPRDLAYPLVLVLFVFFSQGLLGDPLESSVEASDFLGWRALETLK